MSNLYVVERTYEGANSDDRFFDADTIEIRAVAPSLFCPLTNRAIPDGESVAVGGTDWRETSYGAYETFDAAYVAITEKFGEVRDRDEGGDTFLNESDDDGVVVGMFKRGKYTPVPHQVACDEIDEWLEVDATDAQIKALVEKIESDANDVGLTYIYKDCSHESLESYAYDARQELIDELGSL